MGRPRVNRRKAEPKPRLKLPRVPVKGIATVVALVAACVGLFYAAQYALNRPVKKLHVEANFQRVTPSQIEEAASTELARGFLAADLKALSSNLQALSWIETVDVERRWPDTVVVRIQEQMAAARWGDTGLLNQRGELFATRPSHLFPELPQLFGPMGSEQSVAEQYLILRRELIQANLGLAQLTLDDRGAWRFRLENGTEVRLGRRAVDQRLRRFFSIFMPALGSELGRIEHVDMRYTNGFAIGWRPESLAENTLADGAGNG